MCIYRAPDGQIEIFLHKLETLIQKLLTKNKAILLCGDWNIDILHENSTQKDLVDLLQRYNLVNTVQSPTRKTKSTSSLIDLMIINRTMYKMPASIHELGLSDHSAQILPIMCRIPDGSTTKIWRRNFNKNNIKKFIDLLKKTTWHEVVSEYEVNAKFDMFMYKVSTLFDKAFPLKQSKTRKSNKATWITQGIKISSKKVRLFNTLKKGMTLSKGTELYITRYKSIYKRVIKEAKRRDNDRFLLQATNKPKAVWKVINNVFGKPTVGKQDITLDTQEAEIVDLKEIAELFNTYFCEMPVKLMKNRKSNNIPPPGNYRSCMNSCNKSLFLTPITENEVVKVAKSLKNKFTSGSDDIPDYVVKQCIDYLKKPLTDIYNSSLGLGIFPKQLKIAKVTPVHKKGNKRDINNYRPIASLSVFSKVLEKLVYNRMIAFIESNGIITEAQHGFRSKRSTETALQDFINEVQAAIDNKMNPVGLFLDLSKAYDVLDHKRLLDKLYVNGIRGIANQWMESYLSNREQYVELKSLKQGKATSAIRRTSIGVPQGSILGPILFSLYINDLPQNIPNAKTVLFADDTNILITGENTATLQENINSTIKAAQTWFSVNNLIVNIDKTTTMFFQHHQKQSPVLPHVLFEGRTLPVSVVTKFLGLYISESVKWNYHCDSLKSKLNTGYYMIYLLQKITNPHVCRTMYFACFHTHLKYGITLWGRDPQCRKIFLLQKKVIRIMCKVDQQTSCRNLFRKLGILPLPCIYISEMVSWIKYYRGKLKCNSDLHEHDTRHKTDLHPLTCRTNMTKNNGINMAITLYNRLPKHIKKLDTKHQFKKSVKKYLLQNVFYSVDEYLFS